MRVTTPAPSTPAAAATPAGPGPGTPLEALQAALAGEHSAVYGYGVAGARAAPADRPALRAVFDAHRVRRDSLEARVRELGDRPVPAEPAYALPFAVDDQAAARRLAAYVEERLAAVYADLVTVAADADPGDLPDLRDLRELGVSALTDAALHAAIWSGTTAAFPGLPERG